MNFKNIKSIINRTKPIDARMIAQSLITQRAVGVESIEKVRKLYSDHYSIECLDPTFFANVDVKRPLSLKKLFASSSGYSKYLQRYTCDLVERICELTFLVTDRVLTDCQIQNLFEKLFVLYFFDICTDIIKYEINLMFCRVYDLEEPKSIPSPGFEFLFGPLLAKWYQLKKGNSHRFRVKNQEKFLTIFQGFKKGLLPLSPLKVVETVQKHEKVLTKPVPSLDRIPEKQGTFQSTIERKVKSLLQNWDLDSLDYCQNESKAASFEVSREKGGSCAGMMDLYGGHFLSKEFVGYTTRWKEGEGPTVHPIYTSYPDYNTLLHATFSHKPEMKVRPYFILEPLKVRTVTCSTVLGQRFFTGIQRSLWKYLQTFPFFELIGRPLKESDIPTNLPLDEKFISGDYSAATDNLNGTISELILDIIIKKIDDSSTSDSLKFDLIERLRSGFTKSEIVYEKKMYPEMEDVEWPDDDHSVQQTNGQLMGHKISFPILCIANFLVHWISWETYLGYDIPLWKVPWCLINGDDYLGKGNSRFYRIWANVASRFGFELSLGKNFFSDSIVQINSETFSLQFTHQTLENDFFDDNVRQYVLQHFKVHHINYVNFGLLLGRGKGMDPTSEVYPEGQNRRWTNLTVHKDTRNRGMLSTMDIEFSPLESPIATIWRKMVTGLSTLMTEKVYSLWSIQLDYLRQSLSEQYIDIPLPGDGSIFDRMGISAIEYITCLEGSVPSKQTNFPEFSQVPQRDFSLRKRHKKYQDLQMIVCGLNFYEFDEEDQAPCPTAYIPFKEYLKNQQIERDSTESRLTY